MAHKGPSGAKNVWSLIQDLLTSGTALFCFGARKLYAWLQSLSKKQRTIVLVLVLAVLLLLSNALPGPGSSNGGSGGSTGSNRVSTSTRTCLTCLGSGKCDECGGSGYGYVRGSGGDQIKTGCNTCHGSGDCKNSQCKNGNVPA